MTQGYCVRAVLDVEFKAVLSEPQAVLVLVGLVLSGPHNCFSTLSTSCSTCRLSLVWAVQFGQGYLIGFPRTVPRVSRVRVSAVFPVDGRALCGRGVRALLGCRSLIVLYTPLVIILSERHGDLATVAAVLGWDHPSPGMVCTRVLSVQVGTRGTV